MENCWDREPSVKRNCKILVCIYACVCSVAQLCPTLCNPINCSPPGSSVHGILQARTLELAAISFSRALPSLGIEPMIDDRRTLLLSHVGSPVWVYTRRQASPERSSRKGPPVDSCPLPYHNTGRSSHGWALWWAELTLAPLLSSCLGASLISDLPKRKKSKWEKEIPLQALNKHLRYRLLEVKVLWRNVPESKAFSQSQHGQVPLRPKH